MQLVARTVHFVALFPIFRKTWYHTGTRTKAERRCGANTKIDARDMRRFAGIALAMFSRSSDMFTAADSSTFFGEMLALRSGVAWAIYTVAGLMLITLAGVLMIAKRRRFNR